MLDLLALAVIVAAGLYLAALGIGCFVRPRDAAQFLLGFASTAALHYLELAIRVLVGASLIRCAAVLPFSTAFHLAGWTLIFTSLALSAVPWRWHRRFAQRVVPYALRYVRILGASSFALGAFLVSSAIWATVA